MSGSTPVRRAPVADDDSLPFWEALARHQLLLQRCTQCLAARVPRMPGCPRCGTETSEDVVASGRGEIYSWIVVHRPIGTVVQDEVPCTIATIDLAEGCRTVGRLAGNTRPSFGQAVVARFVDRDGWTELAFDAV